MTFHAGKIRMERAYAWETAIQTSSNLRSADDVLLFATTKEQLQKKKKKMCEFKHSTEKVGPRYIRGKRRFLEAKARAEGKEWRLTWKS